MSPVCVDGEISFCGKYNGVAETHVRGNANEEPSKRSRQIELFIASNFQFFI
jgi:hypothetical protein